MPGPSEACHAKCRRAFARRMGQSVLPLALSWWIETIRAGQTRRLVVRVLDQESGSWVDFDCGGHRIRRLRERDNAA